MLKIEKTAKSSQITVKLREREPFLNSFLVKAFLIALLIHLILFLVFHIQPFVIQSSFLFPPIQVQMDRPNKGSLTIQNEQSENEIYSIPPPPLEALFDPFFLPVESHLSSSWIDSDVWNLPFTDLENRMLHYKAPELPIPLTDSPVRIFISGELAERTLIKHDSRIDGTIPFQAKLREPLFISYRVQIDELTGKIFWYERQGSSGVAEMDALSEELLLSLEFAKANKFKSLTGTVDFVLN